MRAKMIQLKRLVAMVAVIAAPLCGTAQQRYAEHSLLATGRWYRIPVATTGVYKITTGEVAALRGVRCAEIALYGDAGGMLSANNTIIYTDDMVPAAVEVVDANGNGVFEDEDYVLFYGEGASVWRYNSNRLQFEYSMHAYANNNYYYLTVDATTDTASDNDLLRIDREEAAAGPFTHTATTHTGVALIHEDRINVNSGGRIWVDSKLTSAYTQRSCNFTFPTVDGVVLARYGLGHVSTSNATFGVSSGVGGSKTHTLYSGEDYQTQYATFTNQGENVTITFTYMPQESSASGYFDYIELNGTQELRYHGGQCYFRNQQLTANGEVCPFYFEGGSSNTRVWDVSDPCQPVDKGTATSGDGIQYFTAPTDRARTFVAFTNADAATPTGITTIDNQDIHGAVAPDYVIVTHTDYLTQANELAELHREHDGLSVLVVTQEQVFNEFSSGKPDPVAIRRMLRCLRSKDSSSPQYLLLFGKGTYDNRDIQEAHQSTVITYQTATSFGDESNIYPSDDIYGYLESTAAGDFEGGLSVGIGRLPAKTSAEASHMVDKITRYITRSDMGNSAIRGDWRNYVALLADDADPSCPYDSVFTSDSEITARSIKALYPHFNIDRIYADAFIQQSGADGSYYPDVNNALRQRINYGCLLLNYIGHGSSSYIGTERYMEFPDIEKYTNTDQLTFFVTSTCSFGRYDQLQDICGAEAFLLADAAGIGIVSASRPIHHTQRFNTGLCLYALNPDNSVGDALRMAKNGSSAPHSVALLGDPALHLSIPRNEVRVTRINQKTVNPMVTDSAEVLSRVTVEGDIVSPEGSLLSDFNGTIYPIVFDREVKCRTLANDNDSTEVNFVQQKNILYKGRDNVSNGHFSYSFIIPRDVAYSYDYAKLSHYATDGVDNATGEYSNIMFGGFNDDLVINEFHPTVQLYINDTTFRNGGITNETPTLYARLSDSVGINAAGCGLGHDITAIIDGNPYSTVTLNDFYEPDINDSRRGEVRYTLGKMEEGMHTLTVKCWNIFNYSGSATVSFRVANDRRAEVGQFVAAPNPAHDRTTLRFEHNMADQIATAAITIFDIRGRQLRHVDLTPTDGSYVLAYPWDFTTADGTALPKGIYIARCIITTTDGQTLSQNTKIVRN